MATSASGTVALLEVIRDMTAVADKCAVNVLFVFLDVTYDDNIDSLSQFRLNYLDPLLHQTQGRLTACTIIGSVLNFDTVPTVQSVPIGFIDVSAQYHCATAVGIQLNPAAFDSIGVHSYMGDFVLVETTATDALDRALESSLSNSTCLHNHTPWLLNTRLSSPDQTMGADERTSRRVAAFADEMSIEHVTIVSDTGRYRGRMQYCHQTYCDGENMVTEGNICFMTSIVRLVYQMVHSHRMCK